MKIIHQYRGTGKTTAVIKESAQTRAVIVCISQEMIYHILRTAQMLKLDIPKPVTMDDVFNSENGRMPRITRLIFDDIDIMLEIFTGCRIQAITATKDK